MARQRDSKEYLINRALNPRSPVALRLALAHELQLRRERQKWAAYVFLTEGQEAVEATNIKPGYGHHWDREYNPLPYPEAKPRGDHRIDMFMGTGIGAIYGIVGGDHYWWELAGWTLTNKGAEVRRRRKF